ncbi:iron-containing alcohol dehydrogenase family protein [Rhodococcus koreensis]|uniref:iron-containing alcohol dehydrogenase family protein n=1 Tax=Rhodococcus koreensis TaxID=99653 RepID=UPI0036731EB8
MRPDVADRGLTEPLDTNTDRELDLRHTTPAFRTFAGDKAVTALPRELKRVGASRAVVVCGPSILRHPAAMSHLQDALGKHLVGVYDGVREHSPLPAVEAARDFLADHDADAVIAVGGGSAVVTARAASILLAEKGNIRELSTQRAPDGKLVSPKLVAPKLPQWVVPSTPTTAYAKAGSAVRDPQTGERLALYDPKTRAQGIILDPTMALTAPDRLTWSASLNAFSMAVEGLQSPHVDPLADALLSQSLRTIVTWLPQLTARPTDSQPRLQLMLAALMSGQGTDHTGSGMAQPLSHAIGPRSTTANGVVEAMLLPHALRFGAEAFGHRRSPVAEALGLQDHGVAAVIDEINRLLGVFDVPTSLREVGVSVEAVTEAADHAMNDWTLTTGPRTVSREDVLDLLNKAW